MTDSIFLTSPYLKDVAEEPLFALRSPQLVSLMWEVCHRYGIEEYMTCTDRLREHENWCVPVLVNDILSHFIHSLSKMERAMVQTCKTDLVYQPLWTFLSRKTLGSQSAKAKSAQNQSNTKHQWVSDLIRVIKSLSTFIVVAHHEICLWSSELKFSISNYQSTEEAPPIPN